MRAVLSTAVGAGRNSGPLYADLASWAVAKEYCGSMSRECVLL